jgi:glycosyltransferase involved in cell wall biosynthesis
MKILHVINDSDVGGAQTLIESLGSTFLGSDVEIELLVLSGPGTLAARLGRSVAHITHLGVDRRSWNVLSVAFRIRAAIRETNPDVIQSHLIQSDLLTTLAMILDPSLPLVWTIHSTGYGNDDRARTRMLSRGIRTFSARAAAIVTCTSAATDFAEKSGLPKRKIVEITNGSVLPPRSAIQPTFMRDDKRVLNLARWHPMKDHENLMRAFSAVMDADSSAQLCCAGPGISRANIELVNILVHDSPAIELLGSVEKPLELIAKSRVLVISSSYGEALPMSGIEALSLGVPVITTDVGSCSLLAVEPWMVCEVSNPLELSAAILRCLGMSDAEYREISDRCRKLAERKFDITSTAAKYLHLYRQLAG